MKPAAEGVAFAPLLPVTAPPASAPGGPFAFAGLGADLGRTFAPPGTEHAQPLDLMSARFGLKAVLAMGTRFNLRRDINNVVTLGGRHLLWTDQALARLQLFMARRCAEAAAWQGSGRLPLEEFVARHGNWNGLYDDSAYYYYLDEFVKQNAKDLLGCLRVTVDALDARLAKTRVRLVDNIELLARVLDLDETERAVLLHASLCKYQRDLRPVLVDCKCSSAAEAYAQLAGILGVPAASVAQALRLGGRLETLGLIDTPLAEHSITDLGDLMRVSDKLLSVLTADYDSETEMMAAFTRPAAPTPLSLADFPHVEEDARYLSALLRAAARRGERGVNVLIYGAPGTGKTELAKLIARQAACELYEVDCLDKDGSSLSGKERYRSLQVSQAFLRGRRDTALLFDEVEDVFPPTASRTVGFGSEERSASVNGKAWVNQTLEQNPVPTLWISNSIGQIDPAYRRRFQFHLELANPPQRVREAIARKYLAQLGVSDAFVAKVAARKQVTPAQIESAARFALLAQAEVDEPAEALVARQLERSDRALGHAEGPEIFRPLVTDYDPGLLNLESRWPVERMLTALAARPRATLCFYGPPGTGKTALAEHIAKTLERPLMIKRASDLMSKYVGETEQQMARMFADATRERAVLLLDEADSFLQNRAGAVRNYEISEVNEMLQGMERFDGVFVCTTNLFDRIDEAALRRFSFKIRFKPLSGEQRERMFVTEALDGDATRLDSAVRGRLAKLEMLTPGDFASVKRQSTLLGDAFEAEEFVEQLEREHAIKPDVKFSKPIGFAN